MNQPPEVAQCNDAVSRSARGYDCQRLARWWSHLAREPSYSFNNVDFGPAALIGFVERIVGDNANPRRIAVGDVLEPFWRRDPCHREARICRAALVHYRWYERRQLKICTATMNATKLVSKSNARTEGRKMSGRPKLSFSHMGIFVTDLNKMWIFTHEF